MAYPGETNIHNPERPLRPEQRPIEQPSEGRPVEIEPNIEGQSEQAGQRETESVSPAETVPGAFTPPPAVTPIAIKSATQQQLEAILQEDLLELYQSLDEPTRQRFKIVGEETAAKIEVLLQSTKVQVKKILELIKQWLKIIPRLNKHFLEQEAKIKTDKILALKNRSDATGRSQ